MNRVPLVVMVLVSSLILVACGTGGASEDSESSADSADGETTQVEGDPESDDDASEGTSDRHGGVLTRAEPGDSPDGLHPHENEGDIYTHTLVGPMYSKLVEWETGPGEPTGDVVPDLAESWDVSEDGMTYTFDLRDDVVWHDIEPVSGRPFVADDVIATIEGLQERPPATGHHHVIARVVDMDAPDDHTLVITLDQPHAPFLADLASHYMWILPREAFDGGFDASEQPIGTGAFMFESYDRNTELVLVRNPDYFIDDKPYLDGLTTVIMPDQGSRTQAVRTGRIDVLYTHDSDEADELTASGDLAAATQFRASTQLFMNQDREPFDDVRVRQAIARAIDWEGMNDAIRGGNAVMTGAVGALAGQFALPEDEVLALRPFDQDAARELLAEAGYEDGFSVNLITTPLYDDLFQRESEWIVQDLGDVGIDVAIDQLDVATFFQRWHTEQDYEFGYGSSASMPAPDDWLRQNRSDNRVASWTNLADPEIDRLYDAQRAEVDEDVRLELIHDTQRYILEEVQNPIYPYSYQTNYIHRADLQDFYPHPSYHGRIWADAWLDS